MPSTSTPKKSPGIFIALVPWILFSFLVAHSTVQVASAAALVAAVAIAIPGLLAGRPKMLELGAVVSFAAFAAIAFAADAATADFIARYARAIAAALLALIAFGSLLFVPFTEQYARESVPRQYWNSPQFKAINRQLSTLWACVFAALVPLHMVAGALDTHQANVLLNWVAPIALIVWAAKRTSAATDGEAPRVVAEARS